MGFINFDMETVEGYVANHLKLFISMVAGLLVFVGIIALSVFFITVKGEEQTMVPDVENMELTSALLELQVKELYPRIQLRYTQTSEDKGLILEQDPRPGSIVKAGRRIRLVVSQGALINTVENFMGRSIDEVRTDLQTLFADDGVLSPPLLSLKEPIMYEYSAEAPGTILLQRPEPGAGISGPTLLELVVSRGPEDALVRAPDFIGLGPEEALELIGRSGVDFTFSLRPVAENETPGVAVSQRPAPGAMIARDTRVSITMTLPKGEDVSSSSAPPDSAPSAAVFNLFTYPMAKNPYPLTLRLEAHFPSGETRLLLATEYSGGDLSAPYNLPLGTILVLSVLNREVHRETVIPPADTLSPDQL